MNAAVKLAAFAVILGGALGGGAALGTAVGPIDVDSETVRHDGSHSTHPDNESAPATGSSPGTGAGSSTSTTTGIDATGAPPPGGPVSQAGYTLVPEALVMQGTPATPFRFRITGPDGAAVRDVDLAPPGAPHLVVVSHDLRTQARLHPTLGSDGAWSTTVPPLAPGPYRAIVDFAVAGGPEVTLGVDLVVPDPAQPAPPPDTGTTGTTSPTTTPGSSAGHQDHGTLNEEER